VVVVAAAAASFLGRSGQGLRIKLKDDDKKEL
jgi:hypothetical protein